MAAVTGMAAQKRAGAIEATARDTRIDAAKGVAIALVVLGHAKGIPAEFTVLAYSFHVPLFFLLSGWLSLRRNADTAVQRLATLARTLLVPYVFFFFVAYGYWLLTRQVGEKALRWGQTPWWEPLGGLVTGIGPRLYVHPALWFLPALLVTALVYFFLGKRLRPSAIALLSLPLAMLWTMAFPAAGLRLPFALDILPVALFFYACGALAGRTVSLPRSALTGGAAAMVLLVPWLWLAWSNGRVDINQLRFGASAWKFVLAALLGTSIVLLASPLAAKSAALRWMGRNTLLILCVHMLVFFVLSGMAAVLGLFPAGSKPGPAWALCVSGISIASCVPLRHLFLRYAPWVLGQRAAGAQAALR
ncbi:acyltransferase family protein [Pseudoxanthomonas sacheonensis]|uniref:acyltransferase family protein n=1 Tax=Pseudoxanthomonas sacheonensis TaxID=443615 RepID=UPI0013D584D8|nr:acyltransferase family protein [Pseudoxanthomonas sacheonensis]KAF1708703.1 polysaccharide biosynthesis protein GumF [Pseudoxanthomonas sacheonensis]